MLTPVQEARLIEIVTDEFGDDLNQSEFAECCLKLFEDIAGFESLNGSNTQLTIDKLWRSYVQHRNQAHT